MQSSPEGTKGPASFLILHLLSPSSVRVLNLRCPVVADHDIIPNLSAYFNGELMVMVFNFK